MLNICITKGGRAYNLKKGGVVKNKKVRKYTSKLELTVQSCSQQDVWYFGSISSSGTGSPGSMGFAGGVWGVRRGPKPAHLFWNLWRRRYGMCSAVRKGQGVFLDFSLQRARGSLKTDHLDGTTDTCIEDISPYNVLKNMHAHTHSVNLCPSTSQDYLLWHASQTHTHMVRSPLVIWAAAWCMMWPTGGSDGALKSLDSTSTYSTSFLKDDSPVYNHTIPHEKWQNAVIIAY